MNYKTLFLLFFLLPLSLPGEITRADLRSVMPQADTFQYEISRYKHWKAYKGQSLTGVCYLNTDVDNTITGYVGQISILIGVLKDRRLSGIKVLAHSENIPEANKIKEGSFSKQFKLKPISDPFLVWKDVDSITGATVTVDAIARSVKITSRKIADCFFVPKPDEASVPAPEGKSAQKGSHSFIQKPVPLSEKKLSPYPLLFSLLGIFLLLSIGINFKLRKKKTILLMALGLELILLFFMIRFFSDHKKKISSIAQDYIPGPPGQLSEIRAVQTEDKKDTSEESPVRFTPKWGIESIDEDSVDIQIKRGNLSDKEAFDYREVE
ncbi:MAG: FMN-binding protein [Spirochaetes bacterium]|nr:FMN-binding protein [Spirochaetota bacterium]